MNIPSNITRAFGKIALVAKKNAPTILVATGVVSGVAATGMAIRATLKCEEVLELHNENMKNIEKARYVVDNDPDFEGTYTEEQEKADRKTVKVQTALQFAKLYFPTVALTALSVTCILAGHHMMSKRNAAVVAAFTAVSSKFDDYREMVKDRLGADVERDIFKRIIEEAELDENGEPNGDIHKEQSKKPVDMSTDRFFDEFSSLWNHNDPTMNVANLRAVTKTAQDKLTMQGYLFLNDVYDMLGIQRTPAGQVLGWLFDKDHMDTIVDFGVYLDPTVIEDPWDFVNDEPWDGNIGILLNFGGLDIIYDKI
jgi:hypothetical protein